MNKIIHQTWKTMEIPDVINIEWPDSWKNNYPTWDYKLWTDDDNRALISEVKPDFLNVYDGYPFSIQRADAIRYFYMYYYGGIYVDLDFLSLKNMEKILAVSNIVIGCNNTCKDSKQVIPNAFLYSIKGHSFWLYCIDQLSLNLSGDVHDTTGSAFLKKCLCHYLPEGLHLLKSEFIYPINWESYSIAKRSMPLKYYQNPEIYFPNSYAVTFWTGSWFSGGGHQNE